MKKSLPKAEKYVFLTNRKKRVALLTSCIFLAASGAVFAIYKTIEFPISRDEAFRETRLDVIMSAPYGSLTMVAGTSPKNVALLEVTSNGDDPFPFHARYGYNPIGTTGRLQLVIGSDEGMLEMNKPIAQSWKANSGYSLASTNAIHSDYGDISPSNGTFDNMLNAPPPPSADENGHCKVYLTKDIPLSISARLGYGESQLDWTGLALTCAYVETGSAKTHIQIREHNAIPMNGCRINASFGEFSMDGISDLNTNRFIFSGGIGRYKLNFNGKLTQNLDATIEVGMGNVSINIPPEAGRVRVMYDDSYFSSFTFNGLAQHKNGVYNFTSVGFDQSTAPILTLHLSSGLGKMTVNYH